MTDRLAPRHVYHVGPWRRWIPLWIFGPIIIFVLGIWAFLPRAESSVAGILLIVIILMTAATQWLIDRARLEISADGIRLRQTGYTLETTWTNVVDLRVEHGREAFITRDAVSGKGQELLAATAGVSVNFMPLYDDRHRALLDEHRLIPFEAFAWHLRHGPLRSEIRNYAPHLEPMLAAIDHPPTGQPAAKTTLQPLRQRDWIVLLLIVAFLGSLFWVSSRSTDHSHLIDTGLGALVLGAFAIQILVIGRNFLRRRVLGFAGAFLLVGTGLALWALATATQFTDALGLHPRPKAALGLAFFAALTLIAIGVTWNSFRRKSYVAGILLIILDLFFAMITLGLWLEFAKL